MRILKNIWSQLHRFVLWALLSTIFWAWIFTLVTDTRPENKVTLYIQSENCRSVELSLKLEETMPGSIKMVMAHPFSYATFSNADLLAADFFVVRESEMEEMLPSFAPLDGESWDYGGRERFCRDGVFYGVKVSDGDGRGAASAYIEYEPGEVYYLFFNVDSMHLGSGDGAALRVAEELLKLDEEG